jgi:hypothetical protein
MEPRPIQQFWINGQRYTIQWSQVQPMPAQSADADVVDRLIEARLAGMTTFPEVQRLLSGI